MAANFGKFDTNRGWAEVTNVVDIINELVILNITHAFFAAATVTCEVLCTVLAYAVMRLHAVANLAPGSSLAYAIAESIAYAIPGARNLNAAAADNRFIRDVRAYFPIGPKNVRLTQANFDAAQQNIHNNDQTATDPTVRTFDITFDPANPGAAAHPVTNLNDAVTVCRMMAFFWYGNSFQQNALIMYVALLVAILKMGNATAAFLGKIANGVQQELNIDVTSIDAGIIGTVWRMVGRFVEETNVGALVTHWRTAIPQAALRLSLTVQQAAGEGLTALTVIKEALNTCADFDWAQVNALLPQEAGNVVAAFNAVGANQFFGFSKNLGVVRSTNYKSYAWVAKELLIRKYGKNSLNGYRGWTRNPAHQNTLNNLINNYVNTPMGAAQYAVGSAAHNQIATMTAAATAATGIA